MIVKITKKSQLPAKVSPHFLRWKDFFKKRMKGLILAPFDWPYEDKNVGAFTSAERYIEWVGDHPKEPEPYKDYGFYTRELTYLSSFIKPEVVVELGTYMGAGTFLLSKLNPLADIVTVDVTQAVQGPSGYVCSTGSLASKNLVKYKQVFGNSWDTVLDKPFNLCFIDAEHTAEAVMRDSMWAWKNKDSSNYCIVWHDLRVHDLGLAEYINAIMEFSDRVGTTVYHMSDSYCAWCFNKGV